MVRGDFVFAIPGDLDTPTGGYAYDRRMIAELRELGWRPEVLGLGDGFPRPNALTKAAAKAHLSDIPKGRPIVIDGLAFGVMPEAARALRETHPLVGLTLEESGTGELVEDPAGEPFGGGVDALELRNLVEVLVVDHLEGRLEHVDGAADIDHDAVGVEFLRHERDRDREGRAMQRLCGAENLALERVSDHDVVGNFNGVHARLLAVQLG